MRHAGGDVDERAGRDREDLAAELDERNAVQRQDALGQQFAVAAVRLAHVDVARQSEFAAEGNEAELSAKPLLAARMQLVHDQRHAPQRALDRRALAVGDPASVRQKQAQRAQGRSPRNIDSISRRTRTAASTSSKATSVQRTGCPAGTARSSLVPWARPIGRPPAASEAAAGISLP